MNATQSNFTSTGEYTNEFDEFGNLIIVEGSDKYLSVILNPEVYEQQSLSSVYNIEIEEFKEVSSAPNQKVASLESEKTNLQKQISDLTTRLQSVNPSEKDTLINASRNVIVSLRIKAGEGSIPSDFNTAFPYLPLFSAAAKASDSSGINSSPTQQTIPSTQTTSSSTNVNQSTSDTSMSSTAKVGTSVTQTLVQGDICPVQQDLQIIPPTDLVIKGPVPVFPTPITIVTPPPAPVQLPIHQMAVAAVTAPQTSCKELFYKYGKYKGVWESLGLQTSPMINTYGVYSEKVSETYERETSDTLPYQVYIPTDGSYTIKFSADNAGYIDMDGVKLIDLSDINSSSPYASQVEAYLGDHATTKTLTAGWKNVNLFYKNWGGPHSVAASIIYNGRVVWNSRMAYNAKDYQECSGNLSMTSYAAQPVSPTVSPKQGCDNPVPTKVYSFVGNIDHTLKITIKGQSASYSNEKNHGDIQKKSLFFNDGLDQINPQLTLKILQGRSSVTLSQQPSVSNDYTAIVDIFDSKGGEGSYSFELYQLKCPVSSVPTTTGEVGGGCPAVWQLMETKELGVVEARHITVGMHLRDSVPGVWNRVNVAYIDVAPIYRVDIDGQVFDVDHSHKWYLGNDQWVKVTDIKAGDFVKTTEGTNVKVNSVNYLRDDQYMHMNVDNQRYVMGTNIIGHNAINRNQSFLAKKF
jgi:hypothetical protein